jgi:hypothetical protein
VLQLIPIKDNVDGDGDDVTAAAFSPEDKCINGEVANVGLDLLMSLSIILFDKDVVSFEDFPKFQDVMKKLDGYERLFLLLRSYENIERKKKISIILGRFYDGLVVPEKHEVIFKIMKNGLECVLSAIPSNTPNIRRLLCALISISLIDKNKENLVDAGLVPILFPLANCYDQSVVEMSLNLLSNICSVNSLEKKIIILKTGIFTILYEKLLQISPAASSYHVLSVICKTIYMIVNNNEEGVKRMLEGDLVFYLMKTIKTIISLPVTSLLKQDVINVEIYICKCFVCCTCFEKKTSNFENKKKIIIDFVDKRIVAVLLDLLDKYIIQIKENEDRFDEDVIKSVTQTLLNISYNGVNDYFGAKRTNIFFEFFESNGWIQRLSEISNFFVNQKKDLSEAEKSSVKSIKMAIDYLKK